MSIKEDVVAASRGTVAIAVGVVVVVGIVGGIFLFLSYVLIWCEEMWCSVYESDFARKKKEKKWTTLLRLYFFIYSKIREGGF